MMEGNLLKPVRLSAPGYVLALHRPEDRVAVLVRNRARGQTMQRILSPKTSRARPFKIGSHSKIRVEPTSSWA
jgi:hypothetical protein